jgi:hypothetical protein
LSVDLDQEIETLEVVAPVTATLLGAVGGVTSCGVVVVVGEVGVVVVVVEVGVVVV